MMGITTGTGDKGRTVLCQGRRVGKDHICIELLGCLDELCSFLGLAKSFASSAETARLTESIQQELFVICSEVATEEGKSGKLERRIGAEEVARLESEIGKRDSGQSRAGCWSVPGGNPAAATLNVARAMARRAERRMVTFRNKMFLKNEHILVYLNRLSDLLFVMALDAEDTPGDAGKIQEKET